MASMVTETAISWTFHERLGVSYTILAASCSLAATLSVLAYAGFRSAKRQIDAERGRGRSDVVDSGIFINLMLVDVLEALAALPNIKWMDDARVVAGPLCTAQGLLKHIGGLGMATSSLAIAVHGFFIIVFDWEPQRSATAWIIAATWAFTAVTVIIPNTLPGVRHGLYEPVRFWCFMAGELQWVQIFCYYIWLWLHGFLMVFLYSIMFAVIRGWLIIDGGSICWNQNCQPAGNGGSGIWGGWDADKEIKAIAKMMFFYPALYIATILPNTLNRWLEYSGMKIPYQVAIVANVLHVGSGFFDVMLLLYVRSKIIRHGPTSNNGANARLPAGRGYVPPAGQRRPGMGDVEQDGPWGPGISSWASGQPTTNIEMVPRS